MGVNRFVNFNYREPVSSYHPLPFEDLYKIGALKQRQQDEHHHEMIDILGKQITALPQDIPLVKDYRQKLQNDLQDLSINGDFTNSDTRNKWYQMKNQIANDFGPLGIIGKVESAYSKHQENIKSKKEDIDKGRADKDSADAILNSDLDTYKGAANGDTYNQTEMANDPKISDQAVKLAQLKKASETKRLLDNGYVEDPQHPGVFMNKRTQKIEQIRPEDTYSDIINTLKNNHENQAYAKQQAIIASHKANKYYQQTGDPNSFSTNKNSYSPDNIEGFANEKYNNEFHIPALSASNLVSYRKLENDEDIHNDPRFDKDEKNKQKYVPVYDTPVTQIESLNLGKAFDIKKKGSTEPYSEEEQNKVYKEFGTSRTGFGKASELASAKLALGKPITEDSYLQPNQMSPVQKTFLLSVSSVDPNIEKKIKNGENLTKEEQDKVYPKAKEVADNVNKDILVNGRAIGLTPQRSKLINDDLFGTDETTVENLGTGNAANLKFYIKEDNKTVSLKELKDKFKDKDKVTIKGEFSGENPYSFIHNGDPTFANARQLNIGGKEVIVSGPREVIDVENRSTNNPENNRIKADREINKIYNLKFTGLPQKINILGHKAEGIFVPSQEDRTQGVYQVLIGDIPYEANSAEELAAKIWENIKNK